MRWFQRERLNFIAERLLQVGHVGRKDLMSRFDISAPTASVDFSVYLARAGRYGHPGMHYNKRTRRYEVLR